jgi:Domain of unknown function (DUF1707)
VLLGDPDRERLYELLGRHAAEGRLSVEELERRVGVVAAARTREEAAAAVADLPPLTAGRPPKRRSLWGRGHGEAEKPEPDWQPTNERFRDPRTRAILRVWVDPGGERHYVAE